MKFTLGKSITGIATATSLFVLATSSALAVNGLNNLCPAPGPFAGVCGSTNQLIGEVVNLVFVVAIIISLAFLIYAGIRYILSQGDKTKVGAAREMIVAALIGLIIVFLSYFLINLAVQMLFGQTVNELVNNVSSNGIFSLTTITSGTCDNGTGCNCSPSGVSPTTCSQGQTCGSANGVATCTDPSDPAGTNNHSSAK